MFKINVDFNNNNSIIYQFDVNKWLIRRLLHQVYYQN